MNFKKIADTIFKFENPSNTHGLLYLHGAGLLYFYDENSRLKIKKHCKRLDTVEWADKETTLSNSSNKQWEWLEKWFLATIYVFHIKNWKTTLSVELI